MKEDEKIDLTGNKTTRSNIEEGNITFKPSTTSEGTLYLKPPRVGYATISVPEPSNWQCFMYGCKPTDAYKTVYRPYVGKVPNWFIRYMMRVCLGCTWVKDKKLKNA